MEHPQTTGSAVHSAPGLVVAAAPCPLNFLDDGGEQFRADGGGHGVDSGLQLVVWPPGTRLYAPSDGARGVYACRASV